MGNFHSAAEIHLDDQALRVLVPLALGFDGSVRQLVLFLLAVNLVGHHTAVRMREGDRAVAFDDGKRRIRLQHLLHQRATLLFFLLVFRRQVHAAAAHTAAHATHPTAATAHAAAAAAHPSAATATAPATTAATAVIGAAGVVPA